MNQIPAGTWVVLADGEGARMLTNVGTERDLVLRQTDRWEPQNVNDDGPSGMQPPELTGADIDRATFAKQLARRLNEAALKNEYAHLLLVADPETLGRVRPILHEQVKQRLVGEVPKCLTNVPLEDLPRALH